MTDTTLDRSSMKDTENQPLSLLYAFLIVLIAASAVRIWVVLNTYVVGPDAFQYIATAQLAERGEWKLFFTQHAMPLYPGMTALINQVVGNIGVAGKITSVLMSVLGALGVFWFAWRLFDDVHLALLTGILFSFHPLQARIGSQIYTTGAYTGTLGITLALLAEASISRRWYWWALSGVAASSTYFARLDGIGIFFVLFAWGTVLLYRTSDNRKSLLYSLGILFLFGLLPTSLLIGYKSYVHETIVLTEKTDFFIDEKTDYEENYNSHNHEWGSTHKDLEKPLLDGRFTLPSRTAKSTSTDQAQSTSTPGTESSKNDQNQVSEQSGGSSSNFNILTDILDEYQEKLVVGTSYFYLLFFVWGLFVVGQKISNIRLSWFLGLFLIAYLTAFLLCLVLLDRLSDRHTVPILCMGLPIAAAGLMSFCRYLHDLFSSSTSNGLNPAFHGVGLFFFLLLLGGSIQKTLTPEGVKKLALREAGETIQKDASKQHPRVMAEEGRIFYYSEADAIEPSWPRDPDQYQSFLTGIDWDYLVLDSANYAKNIPEKRVFLQNHPSVTHLRTITRHHLSAEIRPQILIIYKRTGDMSISNNNE